MRVGPPGHRRPLRAALRIKLIQNTSGVSMKRSLIALACLGASLHALAAPPSSYTIVDLGADMQPLAVNSSGSLAGFTISTRQPAIHADGAWSPLALKSGTGAAVAINSRGTVAGWGGHRSLEWKYGNQKSLQGVKEGQAAGIADDGTVVGYEYGGSHAYCYKWQSGVKSGVGGGIGGDCYATAIDPTATYIGGTSDYAFIDGPAGSTNLIPLGGDHSIQWSDLVALNKYGHAAVDSSFDGTNRSAAAYWNGSALVDLGAHPAGMESHATAINEHDNVLVGGSDGAGHVLFLYAASTGTLTPIEPLIANPAGWTFDYDLAQVLAALGKDGTIYGTAKLDGQPHAFKLVPAN
jgi:hypothetical protein